jgi:hypothetical protein
MQGAQNHSLWQRATSIALTSAGSSSSQVIPNINLLEHAGSFTLVPGTMRQAPLTALPEDRRERWVGFGSLNHRSCRFTHRLPCRAEGNSPAVSRHSALLPCMVRPVRMRRRPVKVRTAQPRPRPALPELPGVVRIIQANPNPPIL